MLNEKQKRINREHASAAMPPDDETVEGGLEEVKRLIGWLEYVREDEYTATEKKKIVAASKRFAALLQPIASKYID